MVRALLIEVRGFWWLSFRVRFVDVPRFPRRAGCYPFGCGAGVGRIGGAAGCPGGTAGPAVGVDTSTAEDEQRAHEQVLDVCVAEIDRCRPLFVGLLGDRFGWTPQSGRLRRAAARSSQRTGLPQDCPSSLSVTGLEFWHGALAPDADAEPVFAVRALGGEVPDGWVEQDQQPGRACSGCARRGARGLGAVARSGAALRLRRAGRARRWRCGNRGTRGPRPCSPGR